MNPLRVGVIGGAEIARRRMLPAMAASPHTDIVAVASRDGEKAEEIAREFGCRAVRGYTCLLGSADIEAVYVPLPAALHAQWVETALLAGKHVLAEKPLTTDPVRTAELLELARARGLVLMENVMFVHHSRHAKVRELLGAGTIGRPHSFHASFAVPERPAHDIRYRAALGGGALFDVGVYPVRAAMHLLGGTLKVVGAVLTNGPGREVDTAGAALLRAEGGVCAQLTFGLEHSYHSAYELRGSEGRITVEHAFTPAADHRPVIRLERRSGVVEELCLEAEDQVAGAVAAFATAVRSGAGSGVESLRQAILLEDIRQLAAGGFVPPDG